jgi:hypothetical protein
VEEFVWRVTWTLALEPVVIRNYFEARARSTLSKQPGDTGRQDPENETTKESDTEFHAWGLRGLTCS